MQITLHAALRTRQRGIRPETLDMIYDFADREAFVGSGAVHIFVSRAMIARLIEMGRPPDQCRQLVSTSLLLDPDTNTVITALRGGTNARRIKRYRSGRSSRLS